MRGFLRGLFLVTLGAIFHTEGLFTVMAVRRTAGLAGLQVCLGNLVGIGFHLEELGVTGIALQPLVRVGLAVKDDLPFLIVPFHFLSGAKSGQDHQTPCPDRPD